MGKGIGVLSEGLGGKAWDYRNTCAGMETRKKNISGGTPMSLSLRITAQGTSYRLNLNRITRCFTPYAMLSNSTLLLS